MHRITGDQKRQHVPHTRVVRHVIETADLQPALALGRHIEAEVCEKIATRDHVSGGPGETDAVGWCGTEPRDDDVLRVHAPTIASSIRMTAPRSEFLAMSSCCSTGEVSSRRAIMVASISTWPISSVPMSRIMSLYFCGRDSSTPGRGSSSSH